MKKKGLLLLSLLILVVVFMSGCPEPPVCGNGICQSNENSATCPQDCKEQPPEPVCGNALCEKNENSSNCCMDCGCEDGYNCKENVCVKAPECEDGEIRYYECPNGEEVEWCTCSEGVWQCIDSPENQCPQLQNCAEDGICEEECIPLDRDCILSPMSPSDFDIFNAEIVVLDDDGSILEGIRVRFLNKDKGFQSPFFWLEGNDFITDSLGKVSRRLVRGEYLVIASGRNNQNEGIFLTSNFSLNQSKTITLTPTKTASIDLSNWAADQGITRLDGEIALQYQYSNMENILPYLSNANFDQFQAEIKHNLDLLDQVNVLLEFTTETEDKYIIFFDNVILGIANHNVPMNVFQNTGKIRINYYNSDETLGASGQVQFRNLKNYFGWRSFGYTPVEGTKEIIISEGEYYMKNNIEPSLSSILPKEVSIDSGETKEFDFGGSLEGKMKVIEYNTQVALDVKDSFGNLLHPYLPDSDLKVIFEAEPGESLPEPQIEWVGDNGLASECDEGSVNIVRGPLGITSVEMFCNFLGSHHKEFNSPNSSYPFSELGQNPKVILEKDYAGFGTINVEGNLLDAENQVTFQNNNIRGNTFMYDEDVAQNMGVYFENFEDILEGMRAVTLLTQTQPIQFETNIETHGAIGGGGGFKTDYWNISEVIFSYPEILGRFIHEMSHTVRNQGLDWGGGSATWYCFSCLIREEGFKAVYGDDFYFAKHYFDGLFDHLAGYKNNDQVDRGATILRYLQEKNGWTIMNNYARIENDDYGGIKTLLQNHDFTEDERKIIIFSYLLQENLFWLFDLTGDNLATYDRIQEGLDLIESS